MSTIFDIRHLRLPKVSRVTAIIATVVVAAVCLAGAFGWRLYRDLTTNTVTVYFEKATALYPGDDVRINGIRVGSITGIEPTGGHTKVTLRYASRYNVPADAIAVIINPSLVASRSIQLAPGYTGGPTLTDNAVIPIERTQIPVEWDELREEVNTLVTELGPTPEQPEGPIGEVIGSLADALAGKGDQLNNTLTTLSEAITTLSEGRGDLFSVVRSIAMFVNTLSQSDRQLVELNGNLARFTEGLTTSDQELAIAMEEVDALLPAVRKLVADNGSVLASAVTNLQHTTNTLMQPAPRNGLETALHVLPNMAANVTAIYEPAHGAVTAHPVLTNFANPLQFICSAVQAASRLGYQESAELCAQYLAPILDAVKFNFPPIGMNLLSTAATLPNQIAYSEERLRPPPGYKDTTVPGVWARDTLFSHGNHEPGWKIAPGMDGLELQRFTQNMLAPHDLASLLGSDVHPSAVPAATGEPTR